MCAWGVYKNSKNVLFFELYGFCFLVTWHKTMFQFYNMKDFKEESEGY